MLTEEHSVECSTVSKNTTAIIKKKFWINIAMTNIYNEIKLTKI